MADSINVPWPLVLMLSVVGRCDSIAARSFRYPKFASSSSAGGGWGGGGGGGGGMFGFLYWPGRFVSYYGH